MNARHEPQQILRLKQVLDLVGLSRSTIYSKIASGEFPAPLKLGKRSVGWTLSSVQQWLTELQPAR